MNKQELASKIWAGANELRGKVSASSYKDYMLGLIFYKYLSEKEERYLKEKLYFDEGFNDLTEEDEDTVKNCEDNLGYFIENKNLFSYWINQGSDFTIADVRTALSAFDRHIGSNYKKVYVKIFDALNNGLNDFGTGDSERTKAIRKLLNLIQQIPVDGSQDYDVLGFVYEFLLKNFAANAGKAGEFYTPYEASIIMSEIIANHLKDRNEISIYDPTSGSGSLLINIGKSVAKYVDNPNRIKYYAQELIPETYNLTRMNLIMHDILPDNVIVRNGDTLVNDWPFFDENDKERTYYPVFVDGCCSNPPYSQSWKNEDADNDIRFNDYGIAPKSKADYAFLLHNLYHLKSDGIMAIVMPHGVLFRGGDEGIIRKNLIEKSNIETIIGLPANMFFGTGIPTIIIILKKQRNTNDVLFIDASKGFAKDGNKNKLRAQDVRKIVDTAISRETIEGYSRLVGKKEIEENDYNLNIPRYVDSSEKQEMWDIYATMFGGIPNNELEDLNQLWSTFPSLKSELFVDSDIPYSQIINDDIRNVILKNKEVKSYLDECKTAFNTFPSYLSNRLIDNYSKVIIAREEAIIAEELKKIVSKIPLVDYYNAYQIFDDNWTTISLDLEILQEDGILAAKVVDPKMVIKKNSKTNELYEKQEGWIGRIFPFELIQSIYFKEEKNELENLISNLDSEKNEKDELFESIDPNDKAELVDDDGEIVSKKLNAVFLKLKKEQKNGAVFEDGSYESIIIKIDDINNRMKKLKKDIKDLEENLESETISKIESLSDKEIRELLEKKWIDPLCESLVRLGKEVINQYLKKLEYLTKKYEVTMHDISREIDESEKALSDMLINLTGNDYDIKGILEFKKLLRGEEDGE